MATATQTTTTATATIKASKSVSTDAGRTSSQKTFKAMMSDAKVSEAPMRGYYYLNLAVVMEIFFSYATYIVERTEASAAWREPRFYVAQYLRSLTCKLQHVAIATRQCMFSNHMIMSSDVRVPSFIQMIIDSYGTKVDRDDVTVLPLLIWRLFVALYTVIDALEVRRPNANTRAALILANWRGYVSIFYGLVPQVVFSAATVFGILEIPFVEAEELAAYGESVSTSIAAYRETEGLARVPAAQYRAMREQHAAVWQNYFTNGVMAAPHAIAPLNAGLVNAIITVQRLLVSPGNVFPAGRATDEDIRRISSPHELHRTLQRDAMTVGSVVILREVSCSPLGSFAPLVYTDEDGATLEAFSPVETTVQEFVIGALLSGPSAFCSPTGWPMNTALPRNSIARFKAFGYKGVRTQLRLLAYNESMVSKLRV